MMWYICSIMNVWKPRLKFDILSPFSTHTGAAGSLKGNIRLSANSSWLRYPKGVLDIQIYTKGVLNIQIYTKGVLNIQICIYKRGLEYTNIYKRGLEYMYVLKQGRIVHRSGLKNLKNKTTILTFWFKRF